MQLHTYLKPRWYFISSFILKSAINSKLEMLFGIRISNNKIYYNQGAKKKENAIFLILPKNCPNGQLPQSSRLKNHRRTQKWLIDQGIKFALNGIL